MARVKIGSVVVALALIVAITGCSSSKKSTTATTTTAGGGVSVTTPAAGSTVAVEVGDTNGLDGPAKSMTMTAAPSTVKAGEVTFTLKNTGTIEHEMVVILLPAGTTYDKLVPETTGPDVDKVSEDASVGEIAETAAGATATVTLNLKAGNYALVCNIAKHYAMGMVTPLTVT
jgi:uncharacterized cupredoxin-like copper-binding protein